MTEQAFTILCADDFEKSGDWLLARRSLGLSAFGMNLVDIRPGGQIPEHDDRPRPQAAVASLVHATPPLQRRSP